eukprot:m51a1_g11034 hypothetical protein (207) ;mRNA; r:427291-428025
MGNAQNAPSKEDAASIPYSVEKGAPTSRPPAGRAQQPAVDSIVTVNNGHNAASAVPDPEISALRTLPKFAPLLRGSISGLLSRARGETTPQGPWAAQPGPLNPTALVILCADFQSELRACSALASRQQEALLAAAREAERQAARASADVGRAEHDLRALTAQLPHVERVEAALAQCKRSAEYTEGSLRRLEAAMAALERSQQTSKA